MEKDNGEGENGEDEEGKRLMVAYSNVRCCLKDSLLESLSGLEVSQVRSMPVMGRCRVEVLARNSYY